MHIITDIDDYNKLFNFGGEQRNGDFNAGRFGDPLLSPSFIQVNDIRAMFYVITIFKKGALGFTFSSGAMSTSPCMVVFKSPFHLYSIRKGSDIEGYYLHFTQSFIGYSFQNSSFHRDFPYFWNEKNYFLIDSQAEATLTEICERIIFEKNNKTAYTRDIIASLLRLFLFEFNKIANIPRSTAANSSDSLLTKFYEIVNTSASVQRSVEMVAGKLHVTADHLWENIKKLTGQTPSEIINEKVITDAKALLLQQHLSVSEISLRLHFKEHAHFTRFFKSHTGLSPTAFVTLEKTGNR